METRIVEHDVVLVVILLKELCSLACGIRGYGRHSELEFDLGIKVNKRFSRHGDDLCTARLIGAHPRCFATAGIWRAGLLRLTPPYFVAKFY